jgi:hypothetical protein
LERLEAVEIVNIRRLYVKLKIKAFLFALKLAIRTFPTFVKVHYNHYIMANTSLNIFGVKSTGKSEVTILEIPNEKK